MNVNLVIIVIIVIIVLSFIVGLVLKRNYKKGLVLLNTTIIPSIGKDRTTIPQNNSTPVMVEAKKIESEKGSVVVSPQIGAIQNSPVVVPNSVPQVVPINETPTVSTLMPAVAPVERPAFVPETIPVIPVEKPIIPTPVPMEAPVERPAFVPEAIPVAPVEEPIIPTPVPVEAPVERPAFVPEAIPVAPVENAVTPTPMPVEAPVDRPAFVPEAIPVAPVEDAVASEEESFTPESIPVIASELISNENDVENNTEIETTISNPLIPLDIPMVSIDDTMPRIEFVDNSSTNEPILIPMDVEKEKKGIVFDSPDEILDLLPDDGDNTDLK